MKTSFSPRNLLLAFLLFSTIIVVISLFGLALRAPDEVTIINEPPETTMTPLSDSDLSRVKKEVFSTLKSVAETEAGRIGVSVRWDSFKKTASGRTSFLIDVDDYRQTYLVNLDQYNVTLSCPEISLSKYPDSFCVGNDGEYDDSISVIFGDELPLSAETSEGEKFEIVRSEISGGQWNRDLAIWIFSCPASDVLTSRVSVAVDALISTRGGSPSAFSKKFYNMSCKGE